MIRANLLISDGVKEIATGAVGGGTTQLNDYNVATGTTQHGSGSSATITGEYISFSYSVITAIKPCTVYFAKTAGTQQASFTVNNLEVGDTISVQTDTFIAVVV